MKKYAFSFVLIAYASNLIAQTHIEKVDTEQWKKLRDRARTALSRSLQEENSALGYRIDEKLIFSIPDNKGKTFRLILPVLVTSMAGSESVPTECRIYSVFGKDDPTKVFNGAPILNNNDLGMCQKFTAAVAVNIVQPENIETVVYELRIDGLRGRFSEYAWIQHKTDAAALCTNRTMSKKLSEAQLKSPKILDVAINDVISNLTNQDFFCDGENVEK